jgi:Ca2+-binding RTX toxin-like protein
LTFTDANTVALTIDASELDAGEVFTLVATDAEVDGALTVTGGGGADVLTTGDGADIITGGGGPDTITGDVGADIIKWLATAGAAMATESGAATGDTDFSAGVAGDKVVGFATGSDKFHFAAAAVTSAAGVETDTLLTIGAAGTVTNVARFVEITASFDGTTGDAIADLAALNTTAVLSGDSFIVFMHDGTNGYLYLVEEAGNTHIQASEVTLIGQVTGVTDVANGDFVSF